ncbi:MAG TPA: MarR family transcriptional regulator [Ktedonobacterales bacterium]|jgi:DNA-binding MarR family transcriptional regulator|nr:MarR family transcriptional regulator [Ktedonobacterales bacterium]
MEPEQPEQPEQVAASQRATTSVADMASVAGTASAEARLGVALWVRLARAYLRNIRLAEARLRAWDLSVAQFDVLAQVGAQEGMIQQELAQRLLVTQGAVTQLLDKLERRGLIRRCPDGRLKRLVLTEEGRRLRDLVVPGQEQFQAEQFAALTRDEQRQLLTLLRKLAAHG